MTENKRWKDKLSKLAASTSTKLQVGLNCEPYVNKQVRNLTTALGLRKEFLINVSVNFERLWWKSRRSRPHITARTESYFRNLNIRR